MSNVSDPATESSQNPGPAQVGGELTSVQQAALRELGNGQTITDAARAAGVDRRTVSQRRRSSTPSVTGSRKT